MPIPTPRKGEDRDHFISRCISFLVREGDPRNQAIAICYSTWRKNKGG